MPPRQVSRKSIAVETVLFIGLFALVGHLTLNFWERYVIQYELNNMKTSLNSLKGTITGIGNAYDNLQSELNVIVKKAEIKPATVSTQKYFHRCKHKRPQYDREIQVVANDNKTDNFNWSESANKNATPGPNYSPMSTGVGSDIVKLETKCNFADCRHNDYDDFELYCCEEDDYCDTHDIYNQTNHVGVH